MRSSIPLLPPPPPAGTGTDLSDDGAQPTIFRDGVQGRTGTHP